VRVVIVGGHGTIGSAVSEALAGRHEVIRASRSNGDTVVDATCADSVQAMFERVGRIDAVVVTLGIMHFGPLAETTPDDFRLGLDDKLMGQVNVALIAQHHLADGGSITLTSGILGDEPIRFGANACCVNHAVEGFVRGAAINLSRGHRINAVSPGVVTESWEMVASFVPGFETVPGSRVARAYVRCVEGAMNGHVLRVH
jgi:NAD(P)-dependent dehydrogenase (short-subunit alcohol dehydrogenase family)